MQKTKYLKLVAILISVMFTAAACGRGPQTTAQKADLIWWKVFSDSRDIHPLIQEFEKANPGVKVVFVEKDVETYEDELINALAAGQGPDIFSIHNDWLPKHQDKMSPAPDKILGLRELRENFVEVLETDLTAEGKIYALPLAFDVLALYYNKDLLASIATPRPPATWQELVDLVPKLTKIDRLGNLEQSAAAMGTMDNVNRATDILSLLMLQNGTEIFAEDRRSSQMDKSGRDAEGRETNPGISALQFYTQFADPAKDSYTWNSRSNNSIDAFTQGKVAMILSYAYLAETLQEKAPFLNYAVAPVPQIGSPGQKINFANYWAEGVSKQSKNPEIAWQFLKVISSKELLETYYKSVKQVSPRLDILEDQIADPDIGVFAENAISSKSFYKPDSDAMENIFAGMINEVVLRDIPVKDALRAGAQKANLLLKSKR